MVFFGRPDVVKMKAKHDVNGLIKALSYDKDISIRIKAAESLGEIGDSRAVDPLIIMIKDKDVEVCVAAVGALGKIKDVRKINPLIAAFGDRQKSIREKAVEALGDDWEPNSDENGARYWIIKRNWDKCVKLGEIAVSPLIDALNYQDVKEEATRALSEIGTPAIKALIARLEQGNHNNAIVGALGRIGDDRAVKPLTIAYRNDQNAQQSIAAALVSIGTPTAAKGLTSFLQHGQDSKSTIAAAALVKMGVIAIEPLLDVTDQVDKDATASVTLSKIIKNVKPIPLKPFLDALESERVKVRRHAASLLGEIGDSLAIPFLTSAIVDTDRYVADAAALALKKLGWTPGGETPDFASIAYYVKNEMWEKCIAIGDPTINYFVEEVIPSRQVISDQVMKSVITVLVKIGNKKAAEALGPLIDTYKYGDAALSGLQEIGAPAVDTLIKNLKQANRRERISVAKSLIYLYRSGKLDQSHMKNILDKRDLMIHHNDSHTDNEYVYEHTDDGIGIDFPL